MKLLSSIICKSLFSYTPYPNSDRTRESKTKMYDLKCDRMLTGDVLMSKDVAQKIKQETYFSDYFTSEAVLIPVPSSTLAKEGSLCVPKRITKALAEIGLGRSIDCLIRTKALPKSSTSRSGERSKAIDHYNTMAVQPVLTNPSKIVLLDDIVTQGATMLGAASKINEAFPDVELYTFAVMRTVTNPYEFIKMIKPETEIIRLDGEQAFRRKYQVP